MPSSRDLLKGDDGPAVAAPAPAPPPAPAPQQQVVVSGQPVNQPAVPPEPDPNSPYASATEFKKPGGRFIRGVRLQGGKHYGGEIVDAHGNVLATFEDNQENTGNPDDGRKPGDEPR